MSITFKENRLEEKEQYRLSQLLRSTQWGDINLSDGGWQRKNMGHHVHKISKWQIKRCLNLNDAEGKQKSPKKHRILRQIKDISFPLLMFLILSDNGICSIQEICFLKIPSLEVLDLSQNQIRTLEPLRKLHSPRLKHLILYKNCITTHRALRQGNWKPTLKIQTTETEDSQDNILKLPLMMRRLNKF